MKLTDLYTNTTEIKELDFIIKEPCFEHIRNLVFYLIELDEKTFSSELEYVFTKTKIIPFKSSEFDIFKHIDDDSLIEYIFYKYLNYKIWKGIFIIDNYMEHCTNTNKSFSLELDDMYNELHFKKDFISIKLKSTTIEEKKQNIISPKQKNISSKEIEYLKFIAIDNSLTDENILEDFHKMDFQPITVNNVSFYFSNSRFEWFKTLCQEKRLFTTSNEIITQDILNSYYTEYGKGFRTGFFSYLDKVEDEIKLFKKEDKIFINKIFSKVIDALNVSLLPIQARNAKKMSKRTFEIIENDLFNSGVRDGEIYKAWCVIAEYSPMFEDIWSKNNFRDELSKKEIQSVKLDTNLQWYGTQTELIELTKALIENGNLKGKQEDIFNSIQKTFNKELNNIDQAITKFNSRSQETETKFIDKLKDTLSKYISTKLNKNR